MPAEPVISISIPESVLDAVEAALHRHLDVMTAHMAHHRDRADRVSWAVAHYRYDRFHDVWSQVRFIRDHHEGLAPETKAELRSFVEMRMNEMPRSKANAVMWAEQKAEVKREREAYRTGRRKGQKR